MKKIKVLHFPIRNTNGGITRGAIRYWEFVDKERFQFDFATCSKKIDFEDEINRQGCKIHYISAYAEDNPEQFCEDLRNILAQGYDAIHLNTSWWKGFLAEKVAKEMGIKVIVVHAHNTYVDINDEKKRTYELENHEKCKEEFTEDLATHFLACSPEAADFLFGEQISRERIKIFHNALDIRRYSFDAKKRETLRKQLGIEEKYVIGNVGRMVYQKNHAFLVECFNEVQKKVPNAVLMLVGGGELEEEIRQQINGYGITDKVIFTGEIDNVEEYMQVMDIFAFPTRFEGLGNVLIEAQTAGLKCLTSDNVPRETCITDNIEYLELNKNLWVEAMAKYANGYDRQNMDEQIKSAGYDITEEIKVIEQIYEEVRRG